MAGDVTENARILLLWLIRRLWFIRRLFDLIVCAVSFDDLRKSDIQSLLNRKQEV